MSQEIKELEAKIIKLAKERERLIAKTARVETQMKAVSLKLQAERVAGESKGTKTK
jgi:hypothetical protein